MSEEKKVHFVSLGCPKNLVDTEMMLGSLSQKGYSVTDDIEMAETIIVNTCGFIEASKKESISTLLEATELKNSKAKTVVAAGCLTQRYKHELVEGLPEVDLFVGSGEFQNIADILEKKQGGDPKKDFFNSPTFLQQSDSPRMVSGPKHSAYLKISEGCKKRCSFCAIPLIRGNLQSRDITSIVNESQLLVAGGAKELIVISHDFTDYAWDLQQKGSTDTPTELLRQLSEQSGADWIRVLYRYPDGISKEMLDLMKEKKNLINYFDMPLQHINNQMLKSMNRKMTKEEIQRVIDEIRDVLPDSVIRTQFIVGFPGETEEQFEELLEFVGHNQFDRVGCFTYSAEEKTPAGRMAGQVDEEIKEQRYKDLMEVQQEISRQKHERYMGQELDVLVEGVSEETELLLQGRFEMQAPEIDGVVYINEGQAEVGEMIRVKVTDTHDYDLVGHRI